MRRRSAWHERSRLGVDALRLAEWVMPLALPVGRARTSRSSRALSSGSSEDRAAANLRSALWRLHRHGRPLIQTAGGRLSLSPDVHVDVHEVSDTAHRVLEGSAVEPLPSPRLYELSLSGDLLPDWYEDWILVERERLRQLRMHALESLCESYAAAGQFAQAIEVGLAAVAAEPLRESAHRALIRCFLAEGNPADAVRQYRRYERTLAEELEVRPSRQMQELMEQVASPVMPA